MCCCRRSIAFLVALLDTIIFLGVIGAFVFFCLFGFGFRDPDNYTCYDWAILFGPLLLFLGAIKIWAICDLFLSTKKKLIANRPKKPYHRLLVYLVVAAPIMLLEVILALSSIGTIYFSWLPFIILLSLAGKNLIFILLLLPFHGRLKKLKADSEPVSPSSVKSSVSEKPTSTKPSPRGKGRKNKNEDKQFKRHPQPTPSSRPPPPFSYRPPSSFSYRPPPRSTPRSPPPSLSLLPPLPPHRDQYQYKGQQRVHTNEETYNLQNDSQSRRSMRPSRSGSTPSYERLRTDLRKFTK